MSSSGCCRTNSTRSKGASSTRYLSRYRAEMLLGYTGWSPWHIHALTTTGSSFLLRSVAFSIWLTVIRAFVVAVSRRQPRVDVRVTRVCAFQPSSGPVLYGDYSCAAGQHSRVVVLFAFPHSARTEADTSLTLGTCMGNIRTVFSPARADVC